MDRYPHLTGWLLVAALVGYMWLGTALINAIAGPTP